MPESSDGFSTLHYIVFPAALSVLLHVTVYYNYPLDMARLDLPASMEA